MHVLHDCKNLVWLFMYQKRKVNFNNSSVKLCIMSTHTKLQLKNKGVTLPVNKHVLAINKSESVNKGRDKQVLYLILILPKPEVMGRKV